jgi:hypothetical protein
MWGLWWTKLHKQVFFWVLWFPLPIRIPPTAPHSSSSTVRGWYNRPKLAAVPSGLSLTPWGRRKKIFEPSTFRIQSRKTNHSTLTYIFFWPSLSRFTCSSEIMRNCCVEYIKTWAFLTYARVARTCNYYIRLVYMFTSCKNALAGSVVK